MNDQRVVEVLLERGQITEAQAKRVRKALDSGATAAKAIQNTPLVEQLEFLRAIQAVQSTPVPPAQPPAPAAAGGIHSAPTEPPSSLDLDENGKEMKVWELEDELDMGTPYPEQGAPEKPSATPLPEDLEIPGETAPVMAELPVSMDLDSAGDLELDSGAADEPVPPAFAPSRPVEPKGQMAKPAASPPPAAAIAREKKLALPRDSTGFFRPGQKLGQYDLADDEGINLIGQVNDLLRDAIGRECGALRLVQSGADTRIEEFGRDGSAKGEQPAELAHMEKVVNRLKVMARIQPWKQEAAQGTFRMVSEGMEYTGILESEDRGGGSILTMTIRPGRV